MADNAQKRPLVQNLNKWARQKIGNALQIAGKALPASIASATGSIVTANFEVNPEYTLPKVACPIAGSQYIRLPVQQGDPGVLIPADAYLGGVSGLGGGIADLSEPANLSALVFFPIGNKNWTPPDDPNAVVIYGPNGVILRDKEKQSTFTLTPDSISMSSGGHSLVINSTGVIIDGKTFLTHEHTDVQSGNSNTGQVA